MNRNHPLSALILFYLIFGFGTVLFAQPVNDDPCGAIEIPWINGPVCTPNIPLSWSGATATPNIAPPGCASYTTGDVWFKFSLTEASDIFITSSVGIGAGAIDDGGMALYLADSCDGTLTKLICDDDSGAGSMPQIQLYAQAPGLYLIRFWDYDDKTTANLGGICVATQTFVSNVVNDEPCDALELATVNDLSCTPSNPQSWVGASASPNFANPGCGSYTTGDVWYKFSLADTMDVVISTLAGIGPDAITDGAMALYGTDSCTGNFFLLACNSNNSPDPMPQILWPALLPSTYYIRFWDALDKTSGNIGGICVATQKAIIVPTLNDEPCDALELTVVEDTLCNPQNPLVWTNATATSGLPNPICGSYSTGDIWFKFNLSAASDIFITTTAGVGPGGITDGAMVLYKADSCSGAFVQLACDDDSGTGSMPQIKEFALPTGTYFIRFWEYGDKVSGNIGGVCVARLPTQSTAPNDICIEAIPFPDIPLDGSCVEVLVNTTGATGLPLLSCGALMEDDVWYTFVAPANTNQLAFSFKQNGNPVQEGLRIYSGICGQLLSVDCFNQPEGLILNLTPGQTYYARTYTTEEDGGAEYSFCLSATPGPVNDDPCGALELTVVEDLLCTPNNPQSWQFAGDTPGLPDPGCNYITGDVWFKFHLDFKADISIKTAAGIPLNAIEDGGMALYAANSCNDLTQITCNDDESQLQLMPQIQASALLPGEYYIRFWDFHGIISGNISGICVAAVPSASVLDNDNCAGAISFPPIPGDGSCASMNINTSLAIGGSGPPVSGFPDDDLWYSFKVPAGFSSLAFELKTIQGNNQQMLCIYDSCGMQSPPRYFYDLETGVISDLVEDKTYWMRVYTFEANVSSEFEVCLKLPPPAPANDLCNSAFLFPSILTDGTCAKVTAKFKWATNTSLECNSFERGDVWFQFTVPDNVNTLIASFVKPSGNQLTPAFQVLSGTCDGLVSVGCYHDGLFESLRIEGLVPGESYFLRAYAYNYDGDGYYDICLQTPSTAAPVNDECMNAIPFPLIPIDGGCASMVANSQGATGDNTDACYGVYDDDVWFSFVMPFGYTNLIANRTIVTGTPFDALGLYHGTCDNLSLVSCHGQGDTLFTGLMGGETYFIRAYSYFANDTANYEICLHVPAVNSQAHDDCIDAIAFSPIPLDGSWTHVYGSTLSALDSGLPACSGFADDDVWYSFAVPPGYNKILFNLAVENAFNDYGLQLEVYSGTCNDLNFLGCYDKSQTGHFDGLVGGETYFLRVYSSENHTAYNFYLGLSVPLALSNDDCETAIAFPTLPKDGTCIQMHGNTALATGTSDPLCTGNEDDDVWYKFKAPDDRTAIYFNLAINFGGITNVTTFSGQCDNLTPLECFTFPNREDVSVLQPNKTYYMRVFTNSTGTSSDFDLCLTAAPLPPANDDCIQAVSITNAPGVFVDPGVQTLGGTTLSEPPICAQFYSNGLPFDAWYSFVTDEDGGDALISLQGLIDLTVDFAYFNLAMQAFSGECDDLSTVWCGGDFSADQLYEMPLEGLDGNTRYYFRVFGATASGGYAPQDFTVFAEGTAFSPSSGTENPLDRIKPNGLVINKIYPSPASTQVTVQFHAARAESCQLILTDLMGQVVTALDLACVGGENQYRIELGQLPAGMYTVTLKNEHQRSTPLRFVCME